eukprot:scaffold3227_cov63-Cyclotella_meneghiniana.AAC.1
MLPRRWHGSAYSRSCNRSTSSQRHPRFSSSLPKSSQYRRQYEASDSDSDNETSDEDMEEETIVEDAPVTLEIRRRVILSKPAAPPSTKQSVAPQAHVKTTTTSGAEERDDYRQGRTNNSNSKQDSFQFQEKDDGETGTAVVGDGLMGASEVDVEDETSGPVEKWSNTCKSKLAIIA